MNERVVKNPNFKNNGEFHRSLASRGLGAKDYPNTHTEVEYLGNDKFASSIGVGHRVFFDKLDGNKPKKHKLTDERANGKDYVLIQGAKCCIEVYPYYAKYFDVQHEEVRLREERWVVQRLFKESDTWRDVDAYNPIISIEEYPEPAGDVVKVTVTYDTDYGILTVEYFQRDGNALKHNVTFKNTSGSTETFRVLQRWAGIAGNKVKTRTEEHEITSKKVLADLVFTFGHTEQPFVIQENLWSTYKGTDFDSDLEQAKWKVHGVCNGCGACCKAYGCKYYNPELPDKCEIHIDKAAQQWKPEQETFEEWLERRDKRCIACFQPVIPSQIKTWEKCSFSFTEKTITEETRIPNSLLRPVAVDTHSQGMKADFIYGDWVLARDELLVIDPDTATLDNPTEDGFLERRGTNGSYAVACAACPTGTLTRYKTGTHFVFGGEAHDIGKGHYDSKAYRAYIEWPIGSLAGLTLTANPTFKYEGESTAGTTEEINPISAQPSAAADADLWTDIASGVAYVDPFNVVVAANQSQGLGAAAKTSLQSAIDASQSWWAIGLQSPDEECPCESAHKVYSGIYSEDDAPTPKPTLYVEYEGAPPGLENKSANMAAKLVAAGVL
jgi:hypothetical protein